MTAALIYFLFAVTGTDAPALNSLAGFPTRDACEAALAKVDAAISGGGVGVHLICISSDSLEELGHKNGIPGN